MIHKNVAAMDYQMLISFGSSTPATSGNTQYQIDGMGGTIEETWGLPYSMGVTGWQANFLNKLPGGLSTQQYTASYTAPWVPGGTHTITDGPHAGVLPVGYMRIYISGYKLVVNSDCSFTMSFTGLTVYLSYNGGMESTLFTTGAYSVTGTSYDERLNDTKLTPYITLTTYLPPNYSPGFTSLCSAIPVSLSDSINASGGYEYLVSGVWVRDPVLFDTTATPGSCSCSGGLPSVTGSDSYSVSVTTSVSASIVKGSVTSGVSCSGCVILFSWWDMHAYWSYSSEYVIIKDKRVSVIEQELDTSWECSLTPGGTTSGSTNATTTPAYTTCASVRSIYVNNQTELGCFTPHTVAPGCTAPCWTTGYTQCIFRASSDLIWPLLPPCTTPIPTGPICSFARNIGWGYVFYGDTTNIYVNRYVKSLDATFIADPVEVDDLSGCWVDGVIQRMYLFYVPHSTSSVYCILSQGFENSWGSPFLISSGTEISSSYAKPLDMVMGVSFDSGTWTAYTSVAGGAFITAGVVVTGVTETKGTLHYEEGAVQQWRFSYPQSGSIVSYVSKNGGQTWVLD